MWDMVMVPRQLLFWAIILRDASACLDATKSFFDEYKENSVLPKKDDYLAVDEIPANPLDDTIAFYFKEGEETFEESKISYKGFKHAARYVREVNSWVSEIWASKLGPNMLVTHGKNELVGEKYGDILCYLVPKDRNSDMSVSGGNADTDL